MHIRIKNLRLRKGFSQEQLSEKARISLRTVQRIEKGESVPRGDTLIKLSGALGVTPDDLLEWQKAEDRDFLILMNLSALSMVLHPILGILIPLVLWISKREKVHLADDSGKNLISFQITWVASLYLIFVVTAQGRYFPYNFNFLKSFSAIIFDVSPAGVLVIGIYLYNISLIFINLRRSQKGLRSRYVPVIPLLR